MPPAIKHALQTLLQHADSSVLEMLDLSGANWKSNPGFVVDALLRHAGLQWSEDGKSVWRETDADGVLEWQRAAAPKTLRPVSRAATALEDAAAVGVQHDSSDLGPGAKLVGSDAAQQRASLRRQPRSCSPARS